MEKVEKPLTPEKEERTEAANKRTINRLLNLYDMVLAEYNELISTLSTTKEAKERAAVLSDFKVLVSMVEPLMKRWYLVHRGYDSNARIEEAKFKAEQEKTAQAALEAELPIEAQIVEVAHWNPIMQELMMSLPKLDDKQDDGA